MANVTYIAPVKAESSIHKIRCAAYCRVSSSSEDQLHSYAAQVKFYSEKFIDSDTEELVDIYTDEGITGTSADKRTEFQRLIRDCKRGKIDRVQAQSISRFARNTKDCLNTIRLLRELGISIVFEKDNIDTAELSDEFMITVMGSLAQEESTSILKNLRWSIRKRMENGTYITPSVPYGYVMKNGKLEVDLPKADIVKMIFDNYLCGVGAQGIVNELNEAKVPTVSRGEKWYLYNVQYILTNERYIGNMLLQKTYGTDTVPVKRNINRGERDKFLLTASHEPIISSELFYKVQELLKINGKQYYKSKGEKNIYTSIIKCGKCGSACKHKKNREKYYWVCREHDISAELCESTAIPDDTLKYCFIRMCNKLIQHYREILLPLRRSLQELNMQRFSGNTKILDIHKNIAD